MRATALVLVALLAGFIVGYAAKAAPEWRRCAPAQDGKTLQSTKQHKNRTECDYVKQGQTRRTPIERKVVK